ncbi:hypothetical protein SDC9_190753 [bioreactor metagenome]|uniref:Uncharacterized protein n=1 Tax=bioreactor metagenome TaxID=1076179 RepID=A0A645I453_9ZZZZ
MQRRTQTRTIKPDQHRQCGMRLFDAQPLQAELAIPRQPQRIARTTRKRGCVQHQVMQPGRQIIHRPGIVVALEGPATGAQIAKRCAQ